jgi:RNA polymerase sigma factor (TIGR02999 family)
VQETNSRQYSGYVTPGIPRILEKVRAGDESALNELVAALYEELHRIASRQLRAERPSHTLQATALVHEAYLKLAGTSLSEFNDRAHFLAVAARVMRQVLVDYARARATKKRAADAQVGAAEHTISLELHRGSDSAQLEILDLDSALEALAQEDPGLVQLIEMRYFGGMTAEETAEVLGQSVHVVRHDLRLAQAWLRRKLSSSARSASGVD